MGGKTRRCLGALLAALLFPTAQAGADPAAWRIEGARGGEVTLLGSMHVLRAVDYPLPRAVDALFDNAEVLVMELDLDDVDPVADRDLILRAATLTPGRTLRSVVAGDVYSLAERRASQLGVDLG